MTRNKYQDAVEQIQTPLALKEKTRNMLLIGVAKRKRLQARWIMGTIAAVLAVATGFGIWLVTGDDLIVSNLVQGEHTEVVTLRDGTLHFTTLTTDDLVAPIRLAPISPLRRSLSLEEYQGVLPANIPDGLFAPDGGITAFFSDPASEPDAILGRVSYQMGSGRTLTIIFTNDASLLVLPVAIEGSQIANVTVGVGFLEAEGVYYGAYLKDGYIFLLTAEGIEQRDFVYLLHAFISN